MKIADSVSRAPGIGDQVKIKRTGKIATVVSTMLGYIQYKSNAVSGEVRQDCWNEFIELV